MRVFIIVNFCGREILGELVWYMFVMWFRGIMIRERLVVEMGI